jgi:hypothetical protein
MEEIFSSCTSALETSQAPLILLNLYHGLCKMSKPSFTPSAGSYNSGQTSVLTVFYIFELEYTTVDQSGTVLLN